MVYFPILVQKLIYIKNKGKLINQNGVMVRKGKGCHRTNVVFFTHFQYQILATLQVL